MAGAGSAARSTLSQLWRSSASAHCSSVEILAPPCAPCSSEETQKQNVLAASGTKTSLMPGTMAMVPLALLLDGPSR